MRHESFLKTIKLQSDEKKREQGFSDGNTHGGKVAREGLLLLIFFMACPFVFYGFSYRKNLIFQTEKRGSLLTKNTSIRETDNKKEVSPRCPPRKLLR